MSPRRRGAAPMRSAPRWPRGSQRCGATSSCSTRWLRAVQNRHADFWQVTGEALDFALDALRIADSGLRDS